MNTANNQYFLNQTTQVWSRPSYAGIAYSDGDEVEERIKRIITESEDVSVLSDEFGEHITDWPSLYHLSRTRANLLRPFREHLGKGVRVLEIGAGCGAITRFLGECGADVLALEGSMRRAEIARLRTFDLQNVRVVADRFDQFSDADKFEVVTLIGVLEYANVFVEGPNAALRMLKHAQSLLKPNGSLILAIENQLGVKYFAGAPEDHTGKTMYGIEGRYQTGEAETFGRKELHDLLVGAGFSLLSCLAAFPDYKLPKSIFTERAFEDKRFDAAALVSPAILRDPQMPTLLAFAPEMVVPALIRNRLMMDLANSFVVVTGRLSDQVTAGDAFAWHYSTDRRKAFCKETVFATSDRGQIAVSAAKLSPSETLGETAGCRVAFHPAELTEYHEGTLLSQEFTALLTRDGWTMVEVMQLLRKYLSFVKHAACDKGYQPDITSHKTTLPGCLLDAVPHNILIRPNETACLIDEEWTLTESLSAGFMVFRSLYLCIHSATAIGKPADINITTVGGFLKSAAYSLGWEIEDSELSAFLVLENEIQHQVCDAQRLDSGAVQQILTRPIRLPRSIWQQIVSVLPEKGKASQEEPRLSCGLIRGVKNLIRQLLSKVNI